MFKKSFIYFIGQALSSLIPFLLIPFYTKYLNPDEFGLATVFLITISFGSILFSLGLNTAYMIKYYKIQERERKFLFTIVLLSFSIIIPVTILFIPLTSLITKYFITNFSLLDLFVLSFSIISSLYFNFFSTLLRNQQKAVQFVIYTFGNALINGILNIIMIKYLKLNYHSLVYSICAANLLFSIVGLIYYKKYIVKINLIDGSKSFKVLLKIGWPIIPSQISSFFLASSDRYLLKTMENDFSVGVYSVGYRFANIIPNFIVNPFFGSYNPTAYELFMVDRSKFIEHQKKFSIILITIITAFVILMEYPFSYLFHHFIDKRYWTGYSIIGIIALVYIFQSMMFIFDVVQTMMEKLHYSLIFITIGASIDIILNIILIPVLGIKGSAIASLISYVFMTIASYLINRKLLKINYNIFKMFLVLVIGFSAIIIPYLLIFNDSFIELFFRILIIILSLCSLALVNLSYLNNYYNYLKKLLCLIKNI